jgi:hypothetical protein
MKTLVQTFLALTCLMDASGAAAQTDVLRDDVVQWARKNLAKGYLAQKCTPLTTFKNWESLVLQVWCYVL